LVKSTWAQEDCGNKISLKEIATTAVDENLGSITINVISSGKFESELFMITGAGKVLLGTQVGEGNEVIIFDNLKAYENLQVLVTFLDEKGAWCKKRQISEIKTFEN
jgi:hypothetical protein